MRRTRSRWLSQTATEYCQPENEAACISLRAGAITIGAFVPPAPHTRFARSLRSAKAREAKERAFQSPLASRAPHAGDDLFRRRDCRPVVGRRSRRERQLVRPSARQRGRQANGGRPQRPGCCCRARLAAAWTHASSAMLRAVLAETRETTRRSATPPHRFSLCFRGVAHFAPRSS